MTDRQKEPRVAADRGGVLSHYDENYFAYQMKIGEFAGWAETPSFAQYVSPTDRVVDFGCGGGYILKNLNCADRIGVEVNEAARAVAREINGLRTVKAGAELPDAWADVIISNHALEHCSSPFGEIAGLLQKLKPGGLFVCQVPHECITNKWKPGSVDNHLYTWNPMTLGNLFTNAGYQIVAVGPFYHIWPPFYATVAKVGQRVFQSLSRIYGSTLKRRNSQVKIVARRPDTPLDSISRR